MAFMDAVSERIVDMIEQSKNMTDDELEALVAQADPEVIETLQRITKAMFRGKKPPKRFAQTHSNLRYVLILGAHSQILSSSQTPRTSRNDQAGNGGEIGRAGV